MAKRKNFQPKHQATKAVFIATAVISFWRGLWGLMDLYIFPSNPPVSFFISLVMGITILYGTHYITRELI